ncbi:MAG TPA: SpoIIE family protein phosphatase [Bellilinea sp.]|nr:SpoIIE family protein phosphatase [Bellilinea sp.]
MEIQFAVAKINKFLSGISGDAVEIVERPNGGLSAVLVDGNTSGTEGRTLSSSIVRKVLSLLGEGVRDGAACRAVSDQLFADYNGQKEVSLNLLSVDLETNTLVISRNNPAPVFVAQGESIDCLSAVALPIGSTRNIRPVISEIQMQIGTTVVLYTDGVLNAGDKFNDPGIDICSFISGIIEDQNPTAQEIADALLKQAMRLDQYRPEDDMTVVVLRVMPPMEEKIRKMTIRYPLFDRS